MVQHLLAAAGEILGGSKARTSLDSWFSPSEGQLDAASQAILSNPALGLQDRASASANPMFGKERSTQQQSQQQQRPLLAASNDKGLPPAMELTHQARANNKVSHLIVT